jgi:hypothetical protein
VATAVVGVVVVDIGIITATAVVGVAVVCRVAMVVPLLLPILLVAMVVLLLAILLVATVALLWAVVCPALLVVLARQLKFLVLVAAEGGSRTQLVLVICST